jgi:hypothetical protein
MRRKQLKGRANSWSSRHRQKNPLIICPRSYLSWHQPHPNSLASSKLWGSVFKSHPSIKSMRRRLTRLVCSGHSEDTHVGSQHQILEAHLRQIHLCWILAFLLTMTLRRTKCTTPTWIKAVVVYNQLRKQDTDAPSLKWWALSNKLGKRAPYPHRPVCKQRQTFHWLRAPI